MLLALEMEKETGTFHEPRNAGSLRKLAKAREQVLRWSLQKEQPADALILA